MLLPGSGLAQTDNTSPPTNTAAALIQAECRGQMTRAVTRFGTGPDKARLDFLVGFGLIRVLLRQVVHAGAEHLNPPYGSAGLAS